MRCLRLPFHFDSDRLRADLAVVSTDEWIPHINRRHYDGQWSGAALRSIAGSATNLIPEARNISEFRDTSLLGRCPYFSEVLSNFRCPLQSVRLLRLHAGSNIAEHVDNALDFEEGEVRIHVPIVTSDEVRFYLDGSRLVLKPGECWYTNVNLPHSVENSGATDRIHLVIDCLVDDWLRDVFARAEPQARDHYAAGIRLRDAACAGRLLEAFSSAANELHKPECPVSFKLEKQTLILSWPGRYSWQIRLRLPDGTAIAPDEHQTARLESSPDPDENHRADYTTVIRRIRAALPEAEVNEW